MDPTFPIAAELWLHPSGTWVFISVPEDESDQIHHLAPNPGGFGSVRVLAQIGATQWRTSVFPDAKSGCFVLPIKKAVRTAEGIDIGDTAAIELTVLIDQ